MPSELYVVPATSFYKDLKKIEAALRAGHQVQVSVDRVPRLQVSLVASKIKSLSTFDESIATPTSQSNSGATDGTSEAELISKLKADGYDLIACDPETGEQHSLLSGEDPISYGVEKAYSPDPANVKTDDAGVEYEKLNGFIVTLDGRVMAIDGTTNRLVANDHLAKLAVSAAQSDPKTYPLLAKRLGFRVSS